MSFSIDKIFFKNIEYSLSKPDKSLPNNITVIVGPNGAGKSRILSALAHIYTKRKDRDQKNWDYPIFENSNSSSDFPSKVVTQTFSPFSRFPVERNKKIELSEYLKKEDSNYSTIGFTRNMGFRGSVSKEVVGRTLRKLLTEPQYAKPLKEAMTSIKFAPIINLGFRQSPNVSSIYFSEILDNGLRESINNYLYDIEKKGELIPDEYRVARELSSSSLIELSNIIFKAIRNIESKKTKEYGINTYTLDLNLNDMSTSQEYLNAFVTLMRLGFLRLVEAHIQTENFHEGNQGIVNASNPINLADASSGEQQLISSLFGIIAEAENDSLILIDEPELSLHPEWQVQVVDYINSVLSVFSGCHVFIATHSALVAQRALELGIEVITLGKTEGQVSDTRDQKHASIEETLLDVFGLAVKDSTYVPRLILSLILEAESNDNMKPTVIRELNKLKSIYENSPNTDKNILNLINDSFSILE